MENEPNQGLSPLFVINLQGKRILKINNPLPFPLFVLHESQVSPWATQLPNSHSAGLLSIPLSSPRLSRIWKTGILQWALRFVMACYSGNMLCYLCYYIPLHFQCLHLLIQTKILTHIHVKQKLFQKIYIPHCVTNISSWSEQKARRQSKASCSIVKESLRAAIARIWSQKKGKWHVGVFFTNHKAVRVTGQKIKKSCWFKREALPTQQVHGASLGRWESKLLIPIPSLQISQQGARTLGMWHPGAGWMMVQPGICNGLMLGHVGHSKRFEASSPTTAWRIQRIHASKTLRSSNKWKSLRYCYSFTLHCPSHVTTHSPKPHLAEVAQATKGFFIEFMFHDLPL